MKMASKRKTDEKMDSDKPSKVQKFTGHWSQGLLTSMDDPELVVKSDDRAVIIKDKYPKAKHHFLVLPKETIPNLKSLKPEHVDLLEHLEKMARHLVDTTDKTLKFRYGYHAVPSMSHLHLHAISQDFDSPCMKTKKHWNSFTTEYFVDSKDVIERLKKHGKVEYDIKESTALLNNDLRCHVCGSAQKNMPALKTHIKCHSYKVES